MTQSKYKDILNRWSGYLNELESMRGLDDIQEEERRLVNEFDKVQMPIIKQIFASTIGESDFDKKARESRNREGKIDSITEGKPFVEEKAPDFLIPVVPMSMPKPNLFYFDYVYGSETDRISKIKKLLNGKQI